LAGVASSSISRVFGVPAVDIMASQVISWPLSRRTPLILAPFLMILVTLLTIYYNYQKDVNIVWYLIGSFVIAFLMELILRIFTHRKITKQIHEIYKRK